MYRIMEDWAEIRKKVLVDGVSRREILRQTGMHRKTLKKILEHSSPPGYRQQKPRPKQKLGAFLERIKQILKEDQAMPRKQRHTAKRIWERLREAGFTGGYTAVVQGPMASQVAIKMLGTNGGGYTNANAAHPFENPTPLSNFLQMLALLCIGSALTYHLGRETKNQKHGWWNPDVDDTAMDRQRRSRHRAMMERLVSAHL